MGNDKNKKEKRQPIWYRIAFLLVLFDAIMINVAYLGALLLRFDLHFGAIPSRYYQMWVDTIPVHTIVSILIYIAFRLYQSIWRYVSVQELERVLIASVVSMGAHLLCNEVLVGRMPISYYCMGWGLELLCITAVRYSYRALRICKRQLDKSRRSLKRNDDYRCWRSSQSSH